MNGFRNRQRKSASERFDSNPICFRSKSTKKPKENKPGTEDEELKSLLTSLDNSINTFTHNPMFQNSKVVSPEDSTNAEKELDAVIKISARIANEADRMKKANAPPE